MNFKLVLLSGLLLFSIRPMNAQPSAEDYFDILANDWTELSMVLSSYEGLTYFCQNDEFRDYSTGILAQIHHMDSVMLAFLLEPESEVLLGKREHQSALKEITVMETRFTSSHFMDHLKSACVDRNMLEKEKGESTAFDSYDGQVLIIETSLQKYLHRIDKTVESLNKHIHRIHPDRFMLPQLVDY